MKNIILSLLIVGASILTLASDVSIAGLGDKDISGWDRGIPVGYNFDKDLSGLDHGMPIGYNFDKDLSSWDQEMPVG